MIFERTGKIFIGRFSSFLGIEGLIHGISLRKGGVSCPPFDSLNTGTGTGDDTEAENENKNLYMRALGIDRNRLALPVQVHGDHIQIAEKPIIYDNTDALITYKRGIFLSVQTADCVPVYIIDKEKRAAALVHAGWRGSALQIVRKTIERIQNTAGLNPKSLYAGIGPSIDVCCYETGDEVRDLFDKKYHKSRYLDLQKFNYDQLVESGIPEHQIESAGICTACCPSLFYSYRFSGGKTGRMMSVLGIND